MGNRHKKMKTGGRTFYSGAGSKVAKEAVEKASGGCVEMKAEGGRAKKRIHKARGGGVGADKHPFSSAYTASTEAK